MSSILTLSSQPLSYRQSTKFQNSEIFLCIIINILNFSIFGDNSEVLKHKKIITHVHIIWISIAYIEEFSLTAKDKTKLYSLWSYLCYCGVDSMDIFSINAKEFSKYCDEKFSNTHIYLTDTPSPTNIEKNSENIPDKTLSKISTTPSPSKHYLYNIESSNTLFLDFKRNINDAFSSETIYKYDSIDFLSKISDTLSPITQSMSSPTIDSTSITESSSTMIHDIEHELYEEFLTKTIQDYDSTILSSYETEFHTPISDDNDDLTYITNDSSPCGHSSPDQNGTFITKKF